MAKSHLPYLANFHSNQKRKAKANTTMSYSDEAIAECCRLFTEKPEGSRGWFYEKLKLYGVKKQQVPGLLSQIRKDAVVTEKLLRSCGTRGFGFCSILL